MASLYDAILVKGNLRPRLNKNFVSPDAVPKVVSDVLTVDNIVDENGTIIVDQKNEQAKQPTEENTEELGPEAPEEPTSLTRVDQSTPETEQPEVQAAPPASSDPAPAPVTIDDSANNQEQTPTEGDQNAATTSNEVASNNKPAPVAQTAPTQPTQPAPAAPAPTPAPQAPAEPARATVADEPVERFRSKVPQSQPGMGFPRKNGKTVDIFDLKTPHTHTKLVAGVAVPLSAENFKSKGEIAIVNRLAELGIETQDFDSLERDSAMAQVADPSLLVDDDETDEDIILG